MTLFYQTHSWGSRPQISEETKKLWKHLANKKNWRITQLPNGFYQTEYQDPEPEEKQLKELKMLSTHLLNITVKKLSS